MWLLLGLLVLSLNWLYRILYKVYLLNPDNDEVMDADLRAIDAAFGTDFEPIQEHDVPAYYTGTTQRDYRLLELFIGPGMHTRLTLEAPALHHAGNTAQMLFVLMEIAKTRAADVLEIGFGHGFCTLFLAALLPKVRFHGIDITKRHVELANRQKRPNTNFTHGDASVDLEHMGLTFDVVFAVEALCHMDTPAKMQRVIAQAARCLRPRGKLVIVDGFRAISSEGERALRLVETGFRIRRLPSKNDWIESASGTFRVVSNTDLTYAALPFWTMGWRVAHCILKFPYLVRWLRSCYKQSAYNLLAVACVAHALHRGAAEYGVLVFERLVD